jgi:hypothetical protein
LFSLPTRSRAFLRQLLQSDAWPSAILVDEFDAGRFKGSADDVESRVARLAEPCLQLMHGHDANGGMVGEILLAPLKESPCGPTLRWRDHPSRLIETWGFFNSIKNLLTVLDAYNIYAYIYFM